MSVFGQQSTTNTEMATGLGQSDYSLKTNYHGSAPLDGSIKFDSWLMPTGESWPTSGGVDCKLVHGDRWQKIEGNMSQHVAQKKTSTYDGEFSDTYNGTVIRRMNGLVGESYHGGTNSRDYLGHLDEHYYAGHSQQNDVEEVETRKWKAEVINSYSSETNPFKFELLGGGVTVAGGELKLLGAEASIAGAHIEAGVIAASFHAYDRGEALIKQELAALEDSIGGADVKLRSWVMSEITELKVVAAPVVVETATDAIVAGI